MAARHVIVDGSNIATEGNSLPTLRQLDEAVREYIRENPGDVVTVVVDATFGHRIPEEERERFEQAELAGEIVSPPAGAIGRGDAFLLRVADKVGGVVLSNDSFQEFHGEYEWLFDKGRLIGGKPVPGIGWVFTPRSPVRGPKSRESVKEARRKRKAEQATAGTTASGLEMAGERPRSRGGERKLQRAIATAVEEAVEPEKAGRKRRRRRRDGEPPAEPLNSPINFIEFITAHRLGSEVEGVVEEFSSHGAFVRVGDARCYLPLSAMADPAPRSAREVLRKGEKRVFAVQAFDPLRRGIELAMPGFAHVAGVPTPETVEAEIHEAELYPSGGHLDGAAKKRAAAKKVEPSGAVEEPKASRRKAVRSDAKAAVTEAAVALPVGPAETVRAAKRAKAAEPAEAAKAAKTGQRARAAEPAKAAEPAEAAKAAKTAQRARAAEPAKARQTPARRASKAALSAEPKSTVGTAAPEPSSGAAELRSRAKPARAKEAAASAPTPRHAKKSSTTRPGG